MSEESLGTDERTWLAAPAIADAPEIDWGPPGRVVVVSPHPDDETLAVGGTLAMLARRGFSVDVVAVTDGEGSHPRSPTVDPETLAARRAAEQRAALVALGIGGARMHRLGVPDGAVARSDLPDRLAPIVAGASLVLAPWSRDGHPDHDAAGRAALAVHDRVVPYLVWAWHWAKPADLPQARLRRIVLDAASLDAKAHAISCFASQIRPLSAQAGDERLLPPDVLARFARPFETVLAP